MENSPKQILESYWAAMQTNDFRRAAGWLHDEFTLDWPQSGEQVRGRENFVLVNQNYPANGPWRFTVRRLLVEGSEVVTEVEVTDGAVQARAITFSTVQDGKILRQTEYWPDSFEPADWRAEWVRRMPDKS